MEPVQFELGQIVMTPGVVQLTKTLESEIFKNLSRHARNDWGDLCEEDIQINLKALRQGGQLMSSYTLSNNVTIWIITEADRTVTTIILPEEY